MGSSQREPVPAHKTSDKTSFAYVTVKDRWPPLVTGALDDVHRTSLACTDEEKSKEGRKIIASLAALKYEIQHDRIITPLEDDAGGYIEAYNKDLSSFGPVKWFNVPWIFTECYLYRRIQAHFTLSRHWKDYDVFARQKQDALRSSKRAILELATRYRSLIAELRKGNEGRSSQEVTEQVLFEEMCQICLWGNAADLSLLAGVGHEEMQKLQGSDARKQAEKNVLINDLPAAYRILQQARSSGRMERKIDIVLDNAGFELFSDLVLAGYLLASGLATQIVLHPKNIPWFVSDVTPKDFGNLLNALANPETFFTSPSPSPSTIESRFDPTTTPTSAAAAVAAGASASLSPEEKSDISHLFQHWVTLYAEGQIILRPHPFWTSGHTYWDLPKQATELFTDLQAAELVIFKGDLNYRKLTADGTWPPTTPFAQAIGPMAGSGVRLLTLRTCKSDVVVGLSDGQDECLRREHVAERGGVGGGDITRREWAWTGKWAVVQFHDGKA